MQKRYKLTDIHVQAVRLSFSRATSQVFRKNIVEKMAQ
jgi:hypothetical protein